METKPTVKVRPLRILWITLVCGLLFIAFATIRYYFRPDSVFRALLFALVSVAGLVFATKIAAVVCRRLFKKKNFRWLFLWVAGVIALTPLLINAEPPYGTQSAGAAMALASARAAVAMVALAIFVMLIRWLCRPRKLRWFLMAVAGMTVLIAGFYVVENWRGKRAWENYKREWEAKGDKFDLALLAPAPVPDHQNFALTPIVASCYRTHLVMGLPEDDQPENTNNRLNMIVERSSPEAYALYPTNRGDWQRGVITDLAEWQKYYRATSLTNFDYEYFLGENPSQRLIGSNVITLSADYPIAPSPQSPAADVLLALSKYDAALDELRGASQLPYARVPLDYATSNAALMLLPHLGSFKACSQILRLRAIAKLQLGQDDLALADVKLALRLMETLQDEPLLISQLVRVAIWQLTVQPIWEGLAMHRWSDAQLTELEASLRKLDFISSYLLAMRGEQASATSIIEHWRRHRDPEDSPASYLIYSACPWLFDFVDDHVPDEVGEFLSPLIPHRPVESLMGRLPPDGWFHQNKVATSEAIRQQATACFDAEMRIVPPGVLTNLAVSIDAWSRQPRSPRSVIARMLVPALTASSVKLAHAQATADMARLACALERYRLEKGEYPESLNALTPRFISQLPRDVIHGNPLKYRRSADGGYVLYSIGWNEVDDGGVVENVSHSRRVNIKSGDWLWWSSTNR